MPGTRDLLALGQDGDDDRDDDDSRARDADDFDNQPQLASIND